MFKDFCGSLAGGVPGYLFYAQQLAAATQYDPLLELAHSLKCIHMNCPVCAKERLETLKREEELAEQRKKKKEDYKRRCKEWMEVIKAKKHQHKLANEK